MLRDDVVAAAAGRFQIHSVSHVDDAIELVSSLPSGDPIAPEPDSINGRIVARLRENALLRRSARGAVQRGRQGPPLRGGGDEHSGAS